MLPALTYIKTERPEAVLVPKKGSTLHDFPYASPARKCFHCWIINVTPAGPHQCLHRCLYCYGREAIYADPSLYTLVYSNLPELVEKDLKRLTLCPPISISNITDPCQDIPILKQEVKRLVQLLMDYGVSFAITTKGDPSFLLELPGFAKYEPKFIAVTIEGTAEVLQLLSPAAPPFAARVEAVRRLSRLGLRTIIRFDPVFVHLFQALYGEGWWGEVEKLVDTFAGSGARHIVASTGRFFRKRSVAPGGSEQASGWEHLRQVIARLSPAAAQGLERGYIFERGASQGYLLRRELRLAFHHRMRLLVEERGLTYATCQELTASESDTPGLPHCEGLLLPFSRKGPEGRFELIPGCTANCHVACQGRIMPPCHQPQLAQPQPFRRRYLTLPALLSGR